ncbi:MAG: Protein-export membrane protein SecF [Parcubacteria group bacterium Athens0714_26]|nr:MAG: Protein-export membrane protein SecF [Parcubacteria group bacterium Athens1014_26]TSD03315.1 MAG: Protein-export membrane protein SecF [Parcubacteria group bacterium Athens0714_26]
MFNLIKYKNLFIGFSATLMVFAAVSIAVFGFRPGIDFTGGTLWQIRFTEKLVSVGDLESYFKSKGLDTVLITADSSNTTFLIRTNELAQAQHEEYLVELQTKFGAADDLRFESIGPTVGQELRNKALLAFIMVLFGISLYVAFAFRKVSYPVRSWKYGFSALVCLFHDALIPAGLYAFFGHYRIMEIDTNFIVALLVIIGFSVHDTIVVFDRIRENLIVQKSKTLEDIINISVNQTFVRSINTSLTLVLVLTALYLFGAATLSYFVLLILIGTVIGTYSSIFVASPLLTYLQKK